MMKVSALVIVLSSLFLCKPCTAQDDGNRRPTWLVDIGLGDIGYPFSQAQLKDGYVADSFRIPHFGVHLDIGQKLTDHLSFHLVYARPVHWVRYETVRGGTGVPSGHSVRTNLAGLALRSTMPLGNQFSLYAEGGLGIATRSGFDVDGREAARGAEHTTFLLGAGLAYHLSDTWDVQTSVIYSPGDEKILQPHTVMFSGGVRLKTYSSSAQQLRAQARSDAFFPKNLIQIGHSTNELGTGINHFFSGGTVPIFWGGSIEVARGIMFRYERLLFRTQNVFSVYGGVSIGNWWSAKGTNFWSLAAYPQFRFNIMRIGAAQCYAEYSLAGPAYLSRVQFDGRDTGKHFTFQDMIGLGCHLKQPGGALNFAVGIGHYSNGNLFPNNDSVKVPLIVNIGYAF